jgi:hypothetical protein
MAASSDVGDDTRISAALLAQHEEGRAGAGSRENRKVGFGQLRRPVVEREGHAAIVNGPTPNEDRRR